MRPSCSSSGSPPSQHSGASTSATSSTHSSNRKRARPGDGMSEPTTRSRAASDDATQVRHTERGGLGHSSKDAQCPLITPAPPSAALARRCEEPQRRRPHTADTADMADSSIAIPTVSEENSVGGHPPRFSSPPSAQPTPASALLPPSLPCQSRVASGDPPTHNAAAAHHAADAPALSLSGKTAHVSSNSRRDFVVMLNHKRMIVPAEHPFLIPRALFAPRAAKAAAEDGRSATGACDVGDCVVAAEGAASRPLHCYGDRPVLLLDCTGALLQRRQRRQRRQELQSRASQLVAARADLLRTKNLWSMRRIRARRQNKELSAPVSAVGDAGGDAGRGSGDSTARAPSGAAEGGDSTSHLLSELSRQRKAITHEMKEIRRELLTLLQEKRKQAATRDGCVLMLPSPETGEVQLFPGHHYRTVCFVGDELREVLPSDADVATAHHWQHRTPPLRKLASEGVARELSGNDEGGAEGEHTSAKMAERPLWAMAELLGYVLYLRQCRRNPHYRSRRGATFDDDSIECQEGREGRVDFDKIAASISYDMVDQYLALPACEMAMYREWAIDKFKLLPPQ
ncbi:hypothetical protein conserved [Leishmania donovani]|nr:hypothetical protein conserved [Leishmania donovani]